MSKTSAPTGANPPSMRERMARAVYAISQKKFKTTKTWEECTPGYRELVLAEVDACLDCLTMPPSDVMIDAGVKAYDEATFDGFPVVGIPASWEAMVAAMIAEGPYRGPERRDEKQAPCGGRRGLNQKLHVIGDKRDGWKDRRKK